MNDRSPLPPPLLPLLPTRTSRPADEAIGARIRARRNLMGMSLEKLGDAVGLTYQQVQKYEKGTNRISASRLQQIAAAIGVSTVFLLGEDGGAGEGGPDYASLMTRDGIDLLRSYHRIQDAQARRHILGLARLLAGDPETEDP